MKTSSRIEIAQPLAIECSLRWTPFRNYGWVSRTNGNSWKMELTLLYQGKELVLKVIPLKFFVG